MVGLLIARPVNDRRTHVARPQHYRPTQLILTRPFPSLLIGNGDSKEDVALRIQLRSMHRVLAAAVIIVAIDAAFDPYSRLRWGHVDVNTQEGCVRLTHP